MTLATATFDLLTGLLRGKYDANGIRKGKAVRTELLFG